MRRKKRRKPKQARNRTLASKRKKQLQQAHNREKRTRFYQRRQQINIAKNRKKAVVFYRVLKKEGTREQDAAQQTALKWQVGCSTILGFGWVGKRVDGKRVLV